MKNKELQSSFIFTRNKEIDYHFIQYPEDKEELKEEILKLQDYFGFLINGKGLYSFRINKYWITSKIIKTETLDHVNRPIYEITGNIYELKYLDNNWFIFSIDESFKNSNKIVNFTENEYNVSDINFNEFINYCFSKNKPSSWAWGCKEKNSDFSGIEFDFRFLPERKKESSINNIFIRNLIKIKNILLKK